MSGAHLASTVAFQVVGRRVSPHPSPLPEEREEARQSPAWAERILPNGTSEMRPNEWHRISIVPVCTAERRQGESVLQCCIFRRFRFARCRETKAPEYGALQTLREIRLRFPR